MKVYMHFGDGSWHTIEVEENDDPAVAIEQARKWVNDNHWFEAEKVETIQGTTESLAAMRELTKIQTQPEDADEAQLLRDQAKRS